MNNIKFQKVILMGRANASGASETLNALHHYLTKLKITVAVEEETAGMLSNQSKLTVINTADFADYELIIVVGGDGSLLHAAQLAVDAKLPVLGINRGRLGFLTDIHPDNLDKVSEVLQGHYQEERRFLLDTELCHEGQCFHHGMALNEVALLPGESPHMIQFDIFIDDQFVCKQRADGIICATPTGSTAYALSGGGPILHPQLDAIVLVPIFPHTLTSRPIVVAGNSTVEICILTDNVNSPDVSLDGQNRISIPTGDKICIHKKANPLRLIHPVDYSYYATLREKLKWESHAELE